MEKVGSRKILIFSLVYYPRFVAGAEIAIKEISDRIDRSDIEFSMVTLRLDSRLPRYEKIGNVHVHRVGWSKEFESKIPWYINLNKYAFLLTGLWKALSLEKKQKFDGIWSMMASYNSFTALFFKILHPRIPFLLTLQEGDPIPYIKRRALPLYPLFKMIFTRAQHIQTISVYLKEFAQSMKATCPISVVPNAVDWNLFSTRLPEEKLQILKDSLGKKTGDVFVITTSRLVEKNAISDVIEALTYLPSNIKFIILGQGEQETYLKQRVEDFKLGDRVKFLGYIAHKDMPQYLHISDIFVRPSLSEGFGSSFVEAMAAGLPVIATPVGGIVDFIRDGETGLFCEPKNPRSIAQKIEKLVRDPESREYIVRMSRTMVQEKYEWGIISERMRAILSDLH